MSFLILSRGPLPFPTTFILALALFFIGGTIALFIIIILLAFFNLVYFLDRLLDDDFVVEVGRLPGWVLDAVAKECFGLGLCLFFLGEFGLLLVAARLERVVAGAGGGRDTVFQVVLLHLGDD